jgi:DNA-binding CsgD family transcriptional regulator
MEVASEQILLDADFGGDRYLLVRMARARAHATLSPRELEVVRMVAKGHPNTIIADVLSISSWTVCTHVRRIFAKLGVGSRAAMVAQLLECGVLPSATRLPNHPNFGGRANGAAWPEGVSHTRSEPNLAGARLARGARNQDLRDHDCAEPKKPRLATISNILFGKAPPLLPTYSFDGDISHLNRALIGLEITDFQGKSNEEALVGALAM